MFSILLKAKLVEILNKQVNAYCLVVGQYEFLLLSGETKKIVHVFTMLLVSTNVNVKGTEAQIGGWGCYTTKI